MLFLSKNRFLTWIVATSTNCCKIPFTFRVKGILLPLVHIYTVISKPLILRYQQNKTFKLSLLDDYCYMFLIKEETIIYSLLAIEDDCFYKCVSKL